MRTRRDVDKLLETIFGPSNYSGFKYKTPTDYLNEMKQWPMQGLIDIVYTLFKKNNKLEIRIVNLENQINVSNDKGDRK